MKVDLKILGHFCKCTRMIKNISVEDAAMEMECSTANVYAFERGGINNAKMLIWYIRAGLNIDEFIRFIRGD